jgi:hypothetical protein
MMPMHTSPSILILSSQLRLHFSSGLFPNSFPSKILYTLLPMRPRWPNQCKHICWRILVTKPLLMYFSQAHYNFSQHPFLYQPQSVFNIRDIVSHPYKITCKFMPLCILILPFIDNRGNILVASITILQSALNFDMVDIALFLLQS